MKKVLTIAFAGLLLVAFTAPAMAKTTVGGILFTDFYYGKASEEFVFGGVNKSNPADVAAAAVTPEFTQTVIEVPVISRLRIRWTNEDNVGMYYETGVMGANGSGASGMRHFYGWWDINPSFRLLAGHTTTPFSPLNPSQLIGTHFGNNGGLGVAGTGMFNVIGIGYGEVYSGRIPQVRVEWKYPNDMGRLAVALVNNHQQGAFIGNATPTGGVDDSVIPRIDVGSPLYFKNFKLYPSVFYQKRSFDTPVPGIDDSFDAWGLSLGGTFGIGPVNFAAEVNYGKNFANTVGAGMAGLSPVGFRSTALFVDTDGDGVNDSFEDATCWGWWVDISFKFGMATPHIIVGNSTTDNDGGISTVDSNELSNWMYGVSCPIGLAKGFSIRPEVMFYDNDSSALARDRGQDFDGDGAQDEIDFGDHLIVGVQFQVTF
jgi:hypothetical protein